VGFLTERKELFPSLFEKKCIPLNSSAAAAAASDALVKRVKSNPFLDIFSSRQHERQKEANSGRR
jgi:hypothetical protein